MNYFQNVFDSNMTTKRLGFYSLSVATKLIFTTEPNNGNYNKQPMGCEAQLA